MKELSYREKCWGKRSSKLIANNYLVGGITCEYRGIGLIVF